MANSSSSRPAVNMGLKLFPPPPTKAKGGVTRKTSVRRHAIQPQSPPTSAVERARSPEIPDGRHSAMDGRSSAMEGQQSAMDGRSSAMGGQQSAMDGRSSAMGGRQSAMDGRTSAMGGRQSAMDNHVSPSTTVPTAAFVAELPRSQTSFSEAPTLVRSYSQSSHSSIAKPPFTNFDNTNANNGSSSSASEQPMIRSIFPRYNPEVPLARQSYYPNPATATSPTYLAPQSISKPQYSPSLNPHVQSPSSPPALNQFSRGIPEPKRPLYPSTTEELKALYKVTNGWRVSPSEGRAFTFALTSTPDAPIHTLSSASSHPFYALSLIPTSTSALLTLNRIDPSKPPPKSSSNTSVNKLPGSEVLSTTLEEVARRHAPNDGLVALLYPKAAATMALDLASKPHNAYSPHGPDPDAIVAAAEYEAARLVWDDDSAHYWLVHPAMTTPFCVKIERSPAWSRVEYTLEHPELPKNLVTLTREGSGGGFLEVDSGVAARIEAFYIVDVAICAILVVALEEEKLQNLERFDAPPSSMPSTPLSPKEMKKEKKREKKEREKERKAGGSTLKFEEMEIDDKDLESQSSLKDLAKEQVKKKKSGMPVATRGILGCLWLMVRCVVWVVVGAFKAVSWVLVKCLG